MARAETQVGERKDPTKRKGLSQFPKQKPRDGGGGSDVLVELERGRSQSGGEPGVGAHLGRDAEKA